MKREILFRGRRSFNGEWVEGSLICVDDYYAILEKNQDLLHSLDQMYINKDTDTMDGQVTRVAPETVGQFTGLFDKNGKKIFEGDIVQCSEPRKPCDTPIRIYYEDGAFMYRHVRKSWSYNTAPINDVSYGLDVEECVIVGNIHDNPELLEVK